MIIYYCIDNLRNNLPRDQNKGVMLNSTFITPQYESRCFSDLPQTILSLFSDSEQSALDNEIFDGLPQCYETVIFFYIDAFGWRFFEKYLDRSPFLQHMMADGVISKITSQFPSTTAAHVTSIHSGLPVGQSGVYEWHYYEPQLDAMIAPLLFSFAGDKKRDTLKSTSVKPADLYPTRTLYQDLRQKDVRSYVLQHRAFTPSTYSKILFKGAKVIPYTTLPEALVNLRQLLAQQDGAAYYFLYFDPIDAICHRYGPQSLQVEAEIETFLTVMDHVFLQPLEGRLDNTLLIMTTDHGQVEVHPDTTVYLNRDPRFSGLDRYLKTTGNDQPLVPGGSARDMFLYIKDDLLEEAQSFLSERLEGIADVCIVHDLIKRGLFGAQPLSSVFLSRVGNLVILPYAHQTVWWYEKGRFEMKFHGHHGGLTREEMEIPLILYGFGDQR